MLLFKFSEARTIRQAMKAFNRIGASGADRDRLRDVNPSDKRRYGRRHGRPQKVEKAFAKLIKTGEVQVIRRKFAPPIVRILTKAAAAE